MSKNNSIQRSLSETSANRRKRLNLIIERDADCIPVVRGGQREFLNLRTLRYAQAEVEDPNYDYALGPGVWTSSEQLLFISPVPPRVFQLRTPLPVGSRSPESRWSGSVDVDNQEYAWGSGSSNSQRTLSVNSRTQTYDSTSQLSGSQRTSSFGSDTPQYASGSEDSFDSEGSTLVGSGTQTPTGYDIPNWHCSCEICIALRHQQRILRPFHNEIRPAPPVVEVDSDRVSVFHQDQHLPLRIPAYELDGSDHVKRVTIANREADPEYEQWSDSWDRAVASAGMNSERPPRAGVIGSLQRFGRHIAIRISGAHRVDNGDRRRWHFQRIRPTASMPDLRAGGRPQED